MSARPEWDQWIAELPDADFADALKSDGGRLQLKKTADHAPEVGRRRPRRLSVADLLANPALLDPPRELIPYLAWEELLTVFAGKYKSGKSTLTAQGVTQAIIANLQARSFLGLAPAPVPVLWLALDEPLGALWRRLHGWGVQHPEDALYFYDHERPDLAQIADDIEEQGIRIVVIDSLLNYARGLVQDVKQPTEWEALFSDLLAITRPRHCAVIAIHHTPHNEVRPADSRQIGASADVIVTLSFPTEQDLAQRDLRALGRGVQYEHRLHYDGQGGFALGHGKPSLSVQLIEVVGRGHGPGKRDLLKDVGGDCHAASRELEALVNSGVIVVEPNGSKHRHYLAATPRPQLDLEVKP